jgi:hypothetical protein
MIQRIQSIYLLLSTFSLGSLFIPSVSFGDFTQPDAQVAATTDGFFNIYDEKVLLGAVTIGLSLTAISIFLYKNRPNQARYALAALLFSFVIMGIGIWYFVNFQKSNTAYTGALNASFLAYIPLALTIIFDWLAIRNIRKDEALVRSADRLR